MLKRHRFLIALLAADVASKLAAFYLLPHGNPVTVLPGLRLYLAVNEWGVMGGVHGMDAVTANSAYTILLAIGLFAFALVVQRLGISSLAFGWRLLVGATAFFVMAFAAEALARPLAHLSLPVDVIIATIRGAVLVLALAFYAASSAPMPSAAFTLLAAGAAGNALSYAYPPFAVVDFVVVPLAPLLELLRAGASSTADASAFGVINLADLYLFAFPLLIIAWPPAAMLRRARRTPRDSAFARLGPDR